MSKQADVAGSPPQVPASRLPGEAEEAVPKEPIFADFDDLNAVARLEKLCFPDPWSTTALYCAMDDYEHVRAFALMIPGGPREEIRAYALFHGVYDEWELFRIAVRPDCRRRGLARSLLQAGIRECRRRGGRVLRLEAREKNLPARSLYEGMGFRIFARRSNYYPDGDDAVLYELKRPPHDSDAGGSVETAFRA